MVKDHPVRAIARLTGCDSPLDTLTCLLRAIAELHAADDLDRGLERLARELEVNLPFAEFSIWVTLSEGEELELRFGLGLAPERQRPTRIGFGEQAVGRAAATRQPIREGGETSCLAYPLLARDRMVGVLELVCSTPGAFDLEHEQLLSVLAPNLAMALENASLLGRLREQERRFADDLRAAREIHHFLLPRKTPWVPGLQTAVGYVPARHLGGDVYDFLSYGPERTAIAVGDVAGKGTGAALYGSLAVGMLRGYAAENCARPEEVLGRLNEELHALGVAQRFIALAFAVFDRRDLTLHLASAGLPYPLLVRRGEVREIVVSGVPLGVLGDVSYEGVEVQLEPGDAVVFTSDGIDETLDGCDQPFGTERLVAVLGELGAGSAREIVDGVLAATDRHLAHGCGERGRTEPTDDRTVLAIKVTG